jgi:WD40 repeat protein/tRNA A-37 threonylcarbamoyl transferase component Bud32
MTAHGACLLCGRALPEPSLRGLCPACLLGVALDDLGDTVAEMTAAGMDDGTEAGGIAFGEQTVAADARQPDGAPDADETVLGQVGGYDVQAVLGRGAMGVVYRARQVSLNRTVALKLLRAGVLADQEELRRFQNEAEAAAGLDHPGIVPVYEVGERDGQRYFSMKLVPGGNLADRLASFRDNPRIAATLVAEAAEAVQHAHVRGILHRDLKPANILVDGDGHPHITDFGLARRVEADSELTATGAILGTPAYMAPEQTLGRRGAITTATDVYGLGAVFYALLTGLAPFRGDSLVETLAKVKEQPPESPRRLNPGVPRDLEVVCLKCLEKDPRRRYASAGALADDLRAWLEGRPIAARPVSPLERAGLFLRRRPALAAAYGLTAAVLLLAGFGGSLVWLWRDAERARSAAVAVRDREAHARLEAEAARRGEALARVEAERQREKVERIEYGRTVQVAYQQWRENDLAAAVALLASTRADLRGWEWHYVHRLCHSECLELDYTTFAGSVSSAFGTASFNPDGSRIVNADPGGWAKVWDATTGAELVTLRGPTHGAEYLTGSSLAAFAPDGKTLVTIGWDNTPRVWDASTGAVLLALKGHTGRVRSVAFSPDGTKIVTTSQDDTARVWDAAAGTELVAFRGHSHPVAAAAFSPDGAKVVTVAGPSVKLWDARTGIELRSLSGHSGFVNSAAFSPDGTHIVTAGHDSTAKVWDAATGAELQTLRGHTSIVSSAAFSPDGAHVVTASGDRTARVWDLKTGVALLTLRAHSEGVTSAAFSPDGSRIVTSGEDRRVKLWDAGGKGHLEVFTIGPDPSTSGGSLESAAFSPDGMRIVTAGLQAATIWDARTGAEILGVRRYLGILSAAFSPDGSRIVTSTSRRTAEVWDAATGAEIATLRGHTDWVTAAAFSPDGARIVTASHDKTAMLWDAATGAAMRTFKGHADSVESVAFSPDGARIVTAGDDRLARVWDAATGATLVTLGGHTARVTSASFSRDGTRIVTASGDRTARVWDAATGATLVTLGGHTSSVECASFGPDGTRIVTAGADHTARVWDAATGAELLTLRGHTNTVTSASFSGDGLRILTSGRDGVANVWDARVASAAGGVGPRVACGFRAHGRSATVPASRGFPRTSPGFLLVLLARAVPVFTIPTLGTAGIEPDPVRPLPDFRLVPLLTAQLFLDQAPVGDPEDQVGNHRETAEKGKAVARDVDVAQSEDNRAQEGPCPDRLVAFGVCPDVAEHGGDHREDSHEDEQCDQEPDRHGNPVIVEDPAPDVRRKVARVLRNAEDKVALPIQAVHEVGDGLQRTPRRDEQKDRQTEVRSDVAHTYRPQENRRITLPERRQEYHRNRITE